MSDQLGAVSIHKAALSIFSIITLPVMAGVMINVFYNKFAAKLVVRAKSLSGILFFVILAGAIFQERSKIVGYFSQAGLLTLSLNVGMMILASGQQKFSALVKGSVGLSLSSVGCRMGH